MIDPTTGGMIVNAPVAGGGFVPLKMLRPSDVIRLANTLKSFRREQVKDDDPEKLRKKLDEFDARPVTRGDLIDMLSFPIWQVEFVRMSLAIDKPDATPADVDALNLDLDELFRTAGRLLHIKFVAASANPPEAVPAPPNRGRGFVRWLITFVRPIASAPRSASPTP